MRDSLRRSLADSPADGFERFAKGSIVLCNACAKPIFRLDHAIALGDKAGRMASAFKPVTVTDLETLSQRTDIDAGVRAMVRSWSEDTRKAHVAQLREVRTGDPMVCPCCTDCFVQVLSVDENEARDKSYTIELLTIAPEGQRTVAVRGKRIGYDQEWVH